MILKQIKIRVLSRVDQFDAKKRKRETSREWLKSEKRVGVGLTWFEEMDENPKLRGGEAGCRVEIGTMINRVVLL